MPNRQEAERHLAQAFAWLDMIAVSGSNVDIMAAARQELRAVRALLQNDETEKTKEEGAE